MLDYPKDLEKMECPVEKTVNLIASKWSLLIIRDLFLNREPVRYSQLLRSLSPISSKTLSQKLKILETYEIVHKDVMATSPPSVLYSLTEKGRDLGPILNAMADFSMKWHSAEC